MRAIGVRNVVIASSRALLHAVHNVPPGESHWRSQPFGCTQRAISTAARKQELCSVFTGAGRTSRLGRSQTFRECSSKTSDIMDSLNPVPYTLDSSGVGADEHGTRVPDGSAWDVVVI
eukprot:3023534-Rhodomonas_salina.1